MAEVRVTCKVTECPFYHQKGAATCGYKRWGLPCAHPQWRRVWREQQATPEGTEAAVQLRMVEL